MRTLSRDVSPTGRGPALHTRAPFDSEVAMTPGAEHAQHRGANGDKTPEEFDVADHVTEKEMADRLKFAKLLAFSGGASMVAWNKFSAIWLMSAGLTPAQTGFLKSLGQLSKLFAQPMWAALADMRIMAKCSKVFEHSHMHFLAVVSLVISLAMMELLRGTVGIVPFVWVALIRTLWAAANSGTTLVDAMVVQMSHRSKEGYGKQRLWGAVAMGTMSILCGSLIDLYGLNFVFIYSHVMRGILICCILYACFKVRHGGLPTEMELNPKSSKKHFNDNMDFYTYVRMVEGMIGSQPMVGIMLLGNMILGCAMVITDFLVSIQMERDFEMSRTLNGLAATISTSLAVPCFYFSEEMIRRYGHFRIMIAAQSLCVVQLLLHACISRDTQLLILPLSSLKGIVFASHWSASVDFMNQHVDPHLVSTSQTLITWAYWTLGGGCGYTLWTWLYQRQGASFTYVAGAVTLLVNICFLRLGIAYFSRMKVAGFQQETVCEALEESVKECLKGPKERERGAAFEYERLNKV